MSFLNELKKQKGKLKGSETIVTSVDGQRFIERGNVKETIASNTYGYVVDTKPDDTPIEVRKCLYIGSQDCATRCVIGAYDIKHVLSLGINVDVANVNHKFVECLDLPETDIKPTLLDSLPFINEAVTLGENVLIHCNAGVSRTAMVAIAYLMHYERMVFEAAYNLVKEKRSAIQPNAGFKKQLRLLTPGSVI